VSDLTSGRENQRITSRFQTRAPNCYSAVSDVQPLLVSIEFILSSASRFSTGEEHLRAELQQLGLPKEHAAALAKVHHDSTRLIREKLLSDSSSPNSVVDFNWRLIAGPSIELDFQLKGTRNISLTADPVKLQTLLYGDHLRISSR